MTPKMKSFYDSPRGKTVNFESELSRVFQIFCFFVFNVSVPDTKNCQLAPTAPVLLGAASELST